MSREQEVTNPLTGETKPVSVWAKKLGLRPKGFKTRLATWDDPVRIFTQKAKGISWAKRKSNNAVKIVQPKNALLCKNPRTGTSLLAHQWADYYKVSLQEMNFAMNKYGRNSLEMYRYLENKKWKN